MAEQNLVVTPLGGGQEVGRSCILLSYKGRNVLLDCGIHPGKEGVNALPYFDEIDPAEIDLVLITHFHLDHCASLPYLTEQTHFRGKIYMTHATKAVMRVLLLDYLRVRSSNDAGLYSEEDLENCLAKVDVLDFHQDMEHKGVKFRCYNAGHVLGAAMFLLDIDGTQVLYTGDYSMEEDRHLMAAEVPSVSPDLLLVESTYGVQVHSSRVQREGRFTSVVEDIVTRGGRCLIPVFATGRAQELLLILDEFWQSRPDLQGFPIYYASKLANRALRIYQTYINMMNAHIRTLMDTGNPFRFAHIKSLKGMGQFDDIGPCVVMASPGMLQSGLSRQLFERWCEDERNGVVLAGYSVEGTLAKKLLSEPQQITCLDGRVKRRKCTIEYISFSAHVDYVQNSEFIKKVAPDNIVLVHGESNQMARLQAELERDIRLSDWPKQTPPAVLMPNNCQEVRVSLPDKPLVADALGAVADAVLHGERLPENTLIVTEHFESKMVTAEELSDYTPLKGGKVQQRLKVRYHGPPATLVLLLRQMFDDVTATKFTGPNNVVGYDIVVHGLVTVSLSFQQFEADPRKSRAASGEPNKAEIVWTASPFADMIADGVTGLLMHSLASPAAMLALQKAADAVIFEEGQHKHTHSHSHGDKRRGKHLLGDSAAVESSEEDEDISEVAKKLKTERSAQPAVTAAVPQQQTGIATQTNVLRLRKIQEGLRSTGYFDAVELNSDRTQLIVRKDNHDAYCRIVWGTHPQKHQAAVECEEQLLKDLLLFCLSNASELLKGNGVPPLPKVLQDLLVELEESKRQREPMSEIAGNDSWGVEVPGLAPLKGVLARRASTSSY